MSKALKEQHLPLSLVLYKKFKEAKKNGKSEFVFHKLGYDLDEDIKRIKSAAYRARIRLEDEKEISFIKLWSQNEKGNRFLYGFKIARDNVLDTAEFIGDLHDDFRAKASRENRLQKRAEAGKETLQLTSRQLKKFILISDSRH